MHVPVWHEATKQLQADGKVRLLGIVQEQHPHRARLFMQWKQMDWPIMVDAQNELGVQVVPITLFIDEHGIVRENRPPRRDRKAAAQQFASATFDPPAEPVPPPRAPDLAGLRYRARTAQPEAMINYARGLVNWGFADQLTTAIAAFEAGVAADDAVGQFQLGVAYRRRLDYGWGEVGDFQAAVVHWGRALELNPNQYIWRRRIQQYGPRLTKPYSFYDWVHEARRDIEARGEAPLPLVVEPSGAEFASPQRAFGADDTEVKEPDPDDRILHDERGFILAERVAVPMAIAPGAAARVHLLFRPNARIRAHWNNESDPMQLWIAPPEGWEIDRRHHTLPNAPAAATKEARRIEFELRAPEAAAPGRVKIPAYVLYNVCEGADGTCLYRRQDITLDLEIVDGE